MANQFVYEPRPQSEISDDYLIIGLFLLVLKCQWFTIKLSIKSKLIWSARKFDIWIQIYLKKESGSVFPLKFVFWKHRLRLQLDSSRRIYKVYAMTYPVQLSLLSFPLKTFSPRNLRFLELLLNLNLAQFASQSLDEEVWWSGLRPIQSPIRVKIKTILTWSRHWAQYYTINYDFNEMHAHTKNNKSEK